MPSIRMRRSWRLLLAGLMVLMGLAVSVQAPDQAYGAFRGCRVDPIVWLSNGDIVQMTAQIATDADDVERITYTLHAPQGTRVTKIVYTGGPLASKEEVVFVDDLPPGRYTTDTVITTVSEGVDVIASTNILKSRASISGRSGEHLVLHFDLGQ